MQIERFQQYLDLFLHFFKEEKLKVNWRENPMTFSTKSSIKDSLKHYDPNLEEQEFIQTIFMILQISKAISIEDEHAIENIEQEFKELVSEKFLNDLNLKNEVATQILTRGSHIENLKYEILTKRSERNPQHILGYSFLLSIDYKDDSENKSKLLLELSSGELSKFIEVLQKAREDIHLLKTTDGWE